MLFQLIPSELSQPVGYADLARQLGVDVGERVPLADARDGGPRAARAAAAWSSTRPTTTPGRAGRSSPTPSCRRRGSPSSSRRAAQRLGAEGPVPPRFTDADGNVKTSAAWLIEQAGFGKGFALAGSGAAVSTKHTLAITNRGGATAADVAALARHLRDGVRDAFGVTLVNEPVFVGHDL